MVPTLTAEFKKLITVRSTYFIVLLALSLPAIFTYLGTAPIVTEQKPVNATSQKADRNHPRRPKIIVSRDLPKTTLITNMHDATPVVSLLIAIAVVLLMGHEYRHNTITYTLTASKSRSRVLLSKIIVGVAFTIVIFSLALLVILAATYLAVHIKNLYLPPQNYNWSYILARLISYGLGISIIGLAIMTLVRNLTAGVVAIFLLPTIDSIIRAILATRNIEATKFLPYSAIERINDVSIEFPTSGMNAKPDLLPATVLGASAVVAIYIVVLWAISWYLFLYRDAT